MTDQNSKTEVHMLLNTYSKGVTDDKNTSSKANTDRAPSQNLNSQLGVTESSMIDDSKLKYSVSTLQVENMLKLNSDTRIEMASIDQLDFNVFYIREQTM